MNAVVLFLILVIPSLVLSYPVKKLSSISKTMCPNQIQELIDRWSPKAKWTAHGISEDESSVYRTPSKKTGVWLELHVQKGGKAELYRISRNTKTKVVWAKDSCIPRMVTSTGTYESKLVEGEMTDVVFESILSTNKTGVVYAWSPHMPYSLVGLKTIRALVKKMGVNLVVVLDPNADLSFAKQQAKKWDVRDEDFKRIESIELLQRQMTMHFPSLLVYSEGKVRGPLFPGVKDEATYERFIKDQMGNR